MLSGAAQRFATLPTAAKLLLILTAAILPIGLGLVWIAHQGILEANSVLRERSEEQSQIGARAIESLIARNALALRIAANGRINDGGTDACERAQRSLTIAPAVGRQFELSTQEGVEICEVGEVGETEDLPPVAPGDIALAVSPEDDALELRVGVIGGMATGTLSEQEIRDAALAAAPDLASLTVADGERELEILAPEAPARGRRMLESRWPIANNRLTVTASTPVSMITTGDQLVLLLPVLMWVVAALMTWVLVTRLLIRPLRRLQRAVGGFQPGDPDFALPQKLGPATEIEELRDAFARAVARVEKSEQEMASALNGQRRLVREVHHRVKNNLQVVASLLNIHSRTAETGEARAAYSAIGRRVGALAIVHRNHFAEMEENRGIALRPLLSELAAELRAGAPEAARGLRVELDLESVSTTQDVAVSVSFLVTEIVEFAMLRTPEEAVEISLRRTSDITARLTLNSPVLVPESANRDQEKLQFERIAAGLAKQLRSDLERKLGRYSVELPVFPPL